MLSWERSSKRVHLFWWCLGGLLVQLCTAARSFPTSAPTAVLGGRVVSARAGCSNSNGTALATLLAKDLPLWFGNGGVTCSFVPWTLLQGLQAEGEMLTGSNISTNSSQGLTDLLEEILRAASSPATLTPLIMLQGESSNSSQFGVTCSIPSGITDAAPVLTTGVQGDGLLLVLPESRMTRTAVFSVQPALGPSTGGTDVYIDGDGLQDPLTCMFSNGSTTLNATATILNATAAMCTAPPWSVGVGDAQSVSLTAVVGSCAVDMPFDYYLEPEVTSVYPLQGPRYGSFQLTVNLGGSLDDLSVVERDGLWPSIRIVGADLNGSDLILPANLTTDRRALMTETPIERTPLAAGDHLIHVSLNGQQYAPCDFIDPAATCHQVQMLTVEGPAVYMSKPHYHFQGGSAAEINVGVYLQGMNTLPVTANLSVSQRSLDGNATLESDTGNGMAFALSQVQLTWGAGDTGQQNVSLAVSGDTSQLSHGGILVSIDSAENADVDAFNATSLVSALDPSLLTVGFALQPNQVAYRGENGSIPVNITNAALRLPAAVLYEITTLAGEVPTYIAANATSGYLQWDLQSGDLMELNIGINWSNVSYDTEDHLMIKLRSAWNSQVPSQQTAVALHVFGVEEGQCPPGTFRFDSSSSPPPPQITPLPPASSLAVNAATGWLQSILVRGGGDWSFDLSSQFQPDVPEYGVIVPANFDNVTLCVQPYQDSAQITLKDSGGNPMPQTSSAVLTASISTSTPTGRRLQSSSVKVPIPGPSSAESGVNALGKKDAGSAAACGSHVWTLPLTAGGNDFSINVGPSQTKAQSQLPPPPPLGKASAPPPPGKAKSPPPPKTKANSVLPNATAPVPSPPPLANGVYTLSVVRLADPAHAEMVELNITDSYSSYAICSSNPGVPSEEAESSNSDADAPLCTPNEVMQLNVSSDTEWISLHPGLRYPTIQGLRVEVAGQVLSQGGNVGADQLADTTATTTVRDNTDFLPVAFVVGLQPGMPVNVPIVVVAEDSVTSLRYYLQISRAQLSGNDSSSLGGLLSGQAGSADGMQANFSGTTISLAKTEDDSSAQPPPTPGLMEQGWPLPPSRQPWCTVCPAGWATTAIDQGQCDMCKPGTFAQAPQSSACLQCSSGTYANSWGSTQCNHCIVGTYTPYKGSELCYMCPENMTNLEDGSSSCLVPVMPGTNLTMRYAVIVSFGVYLNGTSLDEVAGKVGVNASSQTILERLIRSDTASAFNITARDVNVTAITQISRRVLFVNVTATLGVDLPTNSSQDDIQAGLAVKNLSADDAIDMLASHPDRFLGRTTKALDVTAEPGSTPPTRVESRPKSVGRHELLPWYAILLLCLAAVAILAVAARASQKRSRRLYAALLSRCWPSRPHRLDETQRPDSYASSAEHLVGARLGGSGLTARGKPTQQSPDTEPIYGASEYSDTVR